VPIALVSHRVDDSEWDGQSAGGLPLLPPAPACLRLAIALSALPNSLTRPAAISSLASRSAVCQTSDREQA
jgi:hypothetical protein